MAESQENGITILLALKGYQVGKVTEDDKGIVVQVRIRKAKVSCPHCRSPRVHTGLDIGDRIQGGAYPLAGQYGCILDCKYLLV